MRPDQMERLQELEEKLADKFLEEADPDGWSSDNKERYWQRREASDTALLLARAQALMAARPGLDVSDPNDEKEAERLIERTAKRATFAVEKAIARAKARASSQG